MRAHSDAFWIYGVVVGLAITEALTKTISHTFGVLQQVPSAGTDTRAQITIEVFRLIIFLAMIIRFYVGSGIYVDRVYLDEKTASEFTRKNFGVDFLLGLIHFLFFFAWSETVIGHERFQHGLSDFLVLLAIVLLYDCVWWFVSRGYDTVRAIRVWAVLNALTVVLSFVLLVILNDWVQTSPIRAEWVAFIPVAFMTIVDFGEMFSGRNLVADHIREMFKV